MVGISLLHAGQLIPAAATTVIARKLWPASQVVWGGPHISGLGPGTLQEDVKSRSFAADVFVTGHAERTFVELLDFLDMNIFVARQDTSSTSTSLLSSPAKVLLGRREAAAVAPTFENLNWYDSKSLTLPAQSTLGCAYGRCAFCTYPVIEPTPTKLSLDVSVGTVVDQARSIQGSSVSIKDSLVTPNRLKAIGSCIEGNVPWSACTKLHPKLDRLLLASLQNQGLATLEVGLESLLPESQRRVGKIQPLSLYLNFLADVSRVPDLSLVVNYMTGFPWEEPLRAAQGLAKAREILEKHLPPERCRIEHNSFELERLSPMARDPERYGIDRKRLKTWPWASVIENSTCL